MRLSADALNRFGEAIGRGLGARDAATSPTYALVHRYHTPDGRAVYHVDCYRLRTPAEAQDLGFDDMMRDAGIVLIEWPERAGAWAPELDRHFQLSYGPDADTRELEEVR
jgi:tRNA threonylcarbamoyladenosine biosynthesis protein TsaE